MVKWKIKNIIPSFLNCIWSPNMAGWWLSLRGAHPWSYMSLLKSHDKIDMLYLHFHQTNYLQTCQAGHIPWGASTQKARWSFNYMVSWDHLTNSKSSTSFSKRHVITKLIKMVTKYEKFPPLKLHDPSSTCPKKDQVTEWKSYISFFTRFMAIKRVGMVN